MVDGPQVKIRLQLAVGALNLTDQVVVVPCAFLVEPVAVGAQEVPAAHVVHLLRGIRRPPDVGHVLRVLLAAYVLYVIVPGYRRVLLHRPPHALHHLVVALLAVLLRQRRPGLLQLGLEALAEGGVHGLLLQRLARGDYLQEVVAALLVAHAGKAYLLVAVVIHRDGLGTLGQLVVLQACAAHAEVVVAAALYLRL